MGIFSRLLGNDSRSENLSDRSQTEQSPTIEQTEGPGSGQLLQGVEAPGLLLKKKEIRYCAAEAALMEERVKKKRIKGRSIGEKIKGQ